MACLGVYAGLACRSETSFSGGLDFLAAFGVMGSVGMDSCWWRAMTAQYVGGSSVGTRC